MANLALKGPVHWVAEATRSVLQKLLASIANVRIHVRLTLFVDQTLYVRQEIMKLPALVHQDLKVTPFQIKDVLECPNTVQQLETALQIICALPTNVTIHVPKPKLVP
jgi:hypothetical protein